MLYRDFDLIADTRDGGRQAGRCTLCTADRGQSLRNLWSEERPAVCSGLQASEEMCGSTDQEAFERLSWLEQETAPSSA